MKKYILCTTIVSLLCLQIIAQDNLVPNGSFENDLNGWITKDEVMSFADGADFYTDNDVLNLEIDQWDYYSYPSGFLSCNIPDNHFGSQQPADGNKYAGLWTYFAWEGRLIKDNSKSVSVKSHPWLGIKLDEELKKNVEYLVRFRVSKMDNSNKTPEYKVYLSKKVVNNKPSDKWKIKKKTSITNSGDWWEVNISCTPDETGYKYLFFEGSTFVTVPRNNKHAGFYIDQVSVYNKCLLEHPCSMTIDGIHTSHPISSEMYGYSIVVDGLNEVKSASNIEIIDRYQNKIIRKLEDVYSVNGITEPIFWDGRDEDGNEVFTNIDLPPNNNYFWRMELNNDCYSSTYWRVCIFADHLISNPITFSANYTEIPIPKSCCEAEPDITLSNGTLYGHFPVIAQNSITTSGNVIISATAEDYYFQAGNSIKFYPGFHVENGAGFNAYTGTCSPQKSISLPLITDYAEDKYQSSGDIKSYDIYEEKKTDVEINVIDKNKEILVLPNPNNGSFVIDYISANTINANACIYNSLGALIREKAILQNKTQFNLSDQPNGIYFVKISDGINVYHEKIIKH